MPPEVRIDRIETAGRDSRARRIVFSGYAEPRMTSAAAVKALGLAEGDQVDVDELLALLSENEALQARERALRLVGYRERSRRELRSRLLDDGYPSDVVDPLVERFSEYAFVDDERFAASLVRARLSAGYGRRRIERDLAEKGVSPVLIVSALASAECEDEISRATALIGSRPLSTRAERDKVVRRLVSRGFDVSVAYSAVKSAAGTDDGASPFVGE